MSVHNFNGYVAIHGAEVRSVPADVDRGLEAGIELSARGKDQCDPARLTPRAARIIGRALIDFADALDDNFKRPR